MPSITSRAVALKATVRPLHLAIKDYPSLCWDLYNRSSSGVQNLDSQTDWARNKFIADVGRDKLGKTTSAVESGQITANRRKLKQAFEDAAEKQHGLFAPDWTRILRGETKHDYPLLEHIELFGELAKHYGVPVATLRSMDLTADECHKAAMKANGNHGRPCSIPKDLQLWILEAKHHRGLSIRAIADEFKVHRCTVERFLKAWANHDDPVLAYQLEYNDV